MLDSLAPARRRLVLVLAGVVVVVALVAALVGVARNLGGDDSSTAAQDAPGPVVLVPGYDGTTEDVAELTAYARSLGRAAYPFEPPGDGTGSLRSEAAALATFVDDVLDRTGASSVDLVGYSAGGLASRLFVKYDGGDALVRRVLTVGTPNAGTDVAQQASAAVGGCPAACEQMVPGSDLLRRLNAGDVTPGEQRWVTIRSDTDRTVVPTETAELAGALNVRIQDVCPDDVVTHGSLPDDPVTKAALRVTIGLAVPTRPTGVDCSSTPE